MVNPLVKLKEEADFEVEEGTATYIEEIKKINQIDNSLNILIRELKSIPDISLNIDIKEPNGEIIKITPHPIAFTIVEEDNVTIIYYTNNIGSIYKFNPNDSTSGNVGQDLYSPQKIIHQSSSTPLTFIILKYVGGYYDGYFLGITKDNKYMFAATWGGGWMPGPKTLTDNYSFKDVEKNYSEFSQIIYFVLNDYGLLRYDNIGKTYEKYFDESSNIKISFQSINLDADNKKLYALHTYPSPNAIYVFNLDSDWNIDINNFDKFEYSSQKFLNNFKLDIRNPLVINDTSYNKIYFVGTDIPISKLPELQEKSNQPIDCSKTYPRFTLHNKEINICPTGFKGIACEFDCPTKPVTAPSGKINNSEIVGWSPQCGCWPEIDKTQKNESYTYTGERKTYYDKGSFNLASSAVISEDNYNSDGKNSNIYSGTLIYSNPNKIELTKMLSENFNNFSPVLYKPIITSKQNSNNPLLEIEMAVEDVEEEIIVDTINLDLAASYMDMGLDKINNYIYLLFKDQQNGGSFFKRYPIYKRKNYSLNKSLTKFPIKKVDEKLSLINKEINESKIAISKLNNKLVNHKNDILINRVNNLQEKINLLDDMKTESQKLYGEKSNSSMEYNSIYIQYLFWLLIGIITIILVILNFTIPNVITIEIIIAYTAFIAILIYINRNFLNSYFK